MITEKQRRVLMAFQDTDTDFNFLSFKHISIRGGLELKDVRRNVRFLARKGYLEYGKGLWTEDGDPAGSGYCLTKQGKEFKEKMNEYDGYIKYDR